MQAFQRRFRCAIHRRWQEIDDGIDEWHDPDILDRGTAVERNNRTGLDAKAKSVDQLLLRQFTQGEILFQQSIIMLGHSLLEALPRISDQRPFILRYC